MRKSKETAKRINLLDLRPKRNSKWEEKDNRVSIIIPKFKSFWGKKLVKFLGKPESYRLNLDEYGTHVWRMADGSNTVREIGEDLKVLLGPREESVYVRLAKFLNILENRDLIGYSKDKG